MIAVYVSAILRVWMKVFSASLPQTSSSKNVQFSSHSFLKLFSVQEMFNLVFLLSQYQLLELTAKHLSTIDLYHTALACSDLYEIILKSENIFKKLRRVVLCDGSGLRARQSFSGIYNGCPGRFGRPSYEEEIEVRVFNARCDEKGGLPCIKCGINVCEVNSSLVTCSCQHVLCIKITISLGMPVCSSC